MQQGSGRVAMVLVLGACLMGGWPAMVEAQDQSDEPAEVDAEAVQAGTGDAWLDARIEDVDAYAARYGPAFVDEIVRYRDAPRALVEELLGPRGWRAGDVLYACTLARVSGRPCRQVARQWEQGQAVGWVAFASALGVAPGSDALLRVKREIVDSYRRWARPVPLDAALQQALDADEPAADPS